MRIVIENAESTATWAEHMAANGEAVRKAMTIAGETTAQEIEQQGRADIAGAGRFGPAWTDSFKSESVPDANGVTVTTTMGGRSWRKWQEGGTIQGRPLIWIPLSFSDAKGVPYRKYPGELVRVDRAGGKAPLLVSADDRRPKYHGQTSITVRKKFHLTEIAESVGSKIGDRYSEALQGLING